MYGKIQMEVQLCMRKRWKAALDGKTDSVRIGADNGISVEETVNAIKMEPVTYTKTGEAFKSESGTNISFSVQMLSPGRFELWVPDSIKWEHIYGEER